MDRMNIEIIGFENENLENGLIIHVRNPFSAFPKQEAGQQRDTTQPTNTHPHTATPFTVSFPQDPGVETGEWGRGERIGESDWRKGAVCLVVEGTHFICYWDSMRQQCPVFAYLYENIQVGGRMVHMNMERPWNISSALRCQAMSHVLRYMSTGELPLNASTEFLFLVDVINVAAMLCVDDVIGLSCSEIRSRAFFRSPLWCLAAFEMASRVQLTSLRAEMVESVVSGIPYTSQDSHWMMLNYRDLRYLLTHPAVRDVNDIFLLRIVLKWTSSNPEGKRSVAELSPLINFFKMDMRFLGKFPPEHHELLFDPACPLARYYQEFLLYHKVIGTRSDIVEGQFEDARGKCAAAGSPGHSRGLVRSSDTDSRLGGIDIDSIRHMFSWLRPQGGDHRQCIVLLLGDYSEDLHQEVSDDAFKNPSCSRASTADSSPCPVVSSLASVSGHLSVYLNRTPLCLQLKQDSCQPELVPLADIPGSPGIRHASCVWRNCLFVSGTRSDPTSFHVYRPWQNAWEELACLPQPRLDHGMVALDNCIFVLGGVIPESHVHSTVLCYHIAEVGQPQSSWETYAKLLVGVMSPVVAVLDNLIYVIGGITQEGRDSEVIQAVDTVRRVVYMAGPVSPDFTSHTVRAVSYRGHVFLLHHKRGFFALAENLLQLQQVEIDLDTYAFLTDAVKSRQEQSVAGATEAGEEGEGSHAGGQRQDSDGQPEGQPDSLREGGVDPSLLSTMAQTDNQTDNRKDEAIPKCADQQEQSVAGATEAGEEGEDSHAGGQRQDSDGQPECNSAINQKQQVPDCNRSGKQTTSATKMVCNITRWHCTVFGHGIHQSVCDEAGGMTMRWHKGEVRYSFLPSLEIFTKLIKTGKPVTCNTPLIKYPPQSETLRDKDGSPLFLAYYVVHCGKTFYGPGRRLLAVCWYTQRRDLRCLVLYRFTCVPDVFDKLLDFVTCELPSEYDPECLKYIQSDERQSSSLDQASVHKNENVKKAIQPHDQCGEMRDSPLQSCSRQPQSSDNISVKVGENRNEPIQPQMDQNDVSGEVLLSAHNPSHHAHAPTKESHSLDDDCALKGENTATSTEQQRNESVEGEEMKNHVPWYQLPIDDRATADMSALRQAIDQQEQQVFQLHQFELDCFVSLELITSFYLKNCVSISSLKFKDRETNQPLQVVTYHVPMEEHDGLESTFWINQNNAIVYIVLLAHPEWSDEQKKVAEELYKIQPHFFQLNNFTVYPVSKETNPSKHSDRDSHFNEQIYNASHPSLEADSREANLPKAAPARETRTKQGRVGPASHSWNARSMVVTKGTFPRVMWGELFQHSRDTVRVYHVGKSLHVGADFSCVVHDHQLLVLERQDNYVLWVIPFNPDATLSDRDMWRSVDIRHNMGHNMRVVQAHSLVFPTPPHPPSSSDLMPTSN